MKKGILHNSDKITFHVDLDKYAGAVNGTVMTIKLYDNTGNDDFFIGKFECIEDTITGTLWIFDVICSSFSPFTEEALILNYLACIHPNAHYLIDGEVTGEHRKNGVIAYCVTPSYDNIPFGKHEPFLGHVIYVADTAEQLNTSPSVSLIIHDPIRDDKLTDLLASVEKQCREAWCKYLDKGDIESYQEHVEMIIAQAVDKWNESEYT